MSLGLCPPAYGGAGGDDGRWFGILDPEEAGGIGLGLVDITVLMEEMGRALMPGPFFSTVLMTA